MEETMIMNEETTAVVTVDDAEIAELAKVNGVEVSGEVVNVTEDGGINPVVAAGVGLGVTGIVGGLTYLFLKKRKNKKAKNDKVEPKADGTKAAVPATETELNEYLEKLIAETKAVNDKIMELKKTEKNEEEILDEDI